MLLFSGALGVIAFAVWVFCIIDVITSPADRVRNLPKLLWLLIVILLADVGSIAWLLAGRPWGSASARVPVGAGRMSNPDDDDEFLATLTARNEQERRDRESGDDGVTP